MTTKKAIIATLIIGFVAMAGGLGLMFMLVDVTSSSANEKAAALGQMVAIVAMVPMAAVWIAWGLNARRAKEIPQRPTNRKR